MSIILNILLIAFSSVLSWLLSYRFGMLYEYFVPGASGSFVDGTSLVGMPFAYVFLICFTFNAFGLGKKQIWLFFALIPALLIYLLDISHVYYPIIIGIIGWMLGWGVEKVLAMLKKK